ncbi:MAG: ApeI family dehydratase [Gammaproteobacteria bacterium]
MRPDVLATRPGPAGLRLDLRVPADLACFPEHFPAAPVLPGVVQLSWALDLARPHFALPPRFQQVAGLKFMRVVTPGSTLSLDLGFDGGRGELSFCYRDAAGRECSSGRFGFGAEPARG